MRMDFFDQPYYALNKRHMCRVGIWPEQPRRVRKFRPLTMFAVILTLVGPQLVRLRLVWGNMNSVVTCLPNLLCVVVNFTTVTNSMLKADKMKLMLERIEAHWKLFKNTSAVVILEKYAERGRYLTTIYSIYIYTTTVLYLSTSVLPAILDFLHPLNQTRPKNYIYEAEYGVDSDRYYWLIMVHSYIVTIVSMNMIVAIDTMYIMWTEHACALFEIVGFNLNLTTDKYMASQNNTLDVCNDGNYEKIRDCVHVHKEAISFVAMIESIYSASLTVVIGITTILISVTGVQALINMRHPHILIQLVGFNVAQIFHLFFNSIPGQKLIDHSLKVHTFAYDLDWYDMSLKAQKLLTIILIRSKRPCLLTAGKVYVLSMESFGMVMQTAASYFMIFTRLL